MRTLILIAATLAAFASNAQADCRKEDESKPLVTKVEVVNGKRTIVIEKDIVVCGHPPRPAVAYVTSPKQVDYAWEALQQKLTPKILESVKQLGGTRR